MRGFNKQHGTTFEPVETAQILAVFGALDVWIARIRIGYLCPVVHVPTKKLSS